MLGRSRAGSGPWCREGAPFQGLQLMSPPLRPQEEETLSFIRESLEKSDQLTKNMVRPSQPGAGVWGAGMLLGPRGSYSWGAGLQPAVSFPAPHFSSPPPPVLGST